MIILAILQELLHVPYYGRRYFESGTGPIWLSRVECLGNEDTLLNCSHSKTDIDLCMYYGDAGVICRGNSYKSTVQSG